MSSESRVFNCQFSVFSSIENPKSKIQNAYWDAPLGGLLLCVATFVLVFGGVVFGQTFLHRTTRASGERSDLLGAFTQWDSQSYGKIADGGYDYSPDRRNLIVHYPAYPIAGHWLARLTGMRTDLALLILANACFAVACAAIAARGAEGELAAGTKPAGATPGGLRPAATDVAAAEDGPTAGTTPAGLRPAAKGIAAMEEFRLNLACFCALSLCLFPTTMFMRMAYTEGPFVCLQGLALLGLRRRWPLILLAAIVGLGTATRPVGAALLLPLLWRVKCDGGGPLRVVGRAVLYGAIGSWGVAAFMLYQHLAFGDALAFVRNNEHWRAVPAIPWSEHLWALVTFKPLWQVYVPSSPAFWLRLEYHPEAGFSLTFANPIYFVLALGLLIVGRKQRWIDTGELLLGLGLLAIPYCSKSYDMAFMGMGRFVGAIVPMHIVCGNILARMPAPLAAAALAISTALLAAYAALFAAGYMII